MLKKRSDKKAFYGIPGDNSTVFTRMKYFTEFSISKNPSEYARQYVDEDVERTDAVKYSPSASFSFDDHSDNAVLADIADIIDNEKVGTEAQREVIFVDFTKNSGNGFEAYKRTFAIIADSEGGSLDAYTYSGTFKSVGVQIKGIATISAPENGNSSNVETIEFTENSGN